MASPHARQPRTRRPGFEQLESRELLFSNGVLNHVLGFPTGLGPPRHEEITDMALGFIKDEVLNEIKDENVAIDVADIAELKLGGAGHPENHFDGSAFYYSALTINARYQAFLNRFDTDDPFESDALAEIFGTVLHPVQDFYSHSNWVNYVASGVIANGSLLDRGTSLWPPLLPYSEIQPGVLLVQGEDLMPVVLGRGTAILQRTGFDVEVQFAPSGVKMKGLITNDFPGETNYTPDNVSVPHDDTIIRGSLVLGLNKDTPDRDLHFKASAYAMVQTQHEFIRLVALVRDRFGEAGVCELLEHWVKPDPISQAAARKLLGLPIADGKLLDLIFAIDTTGSMEDDIDAVKAQATSIVTSITAERPITRIGIVLYKDFGDTFVARTLLPFSCDPEEIIEAIESISVGGGGDTPEAVYSALVHAIDAGEDLGEWRQEGLIEKVIITLGDAPPHDPEPSSKPTDTGYRLSDVLAKAREGGVAVAPLAAVAQSSSGVALGRLDVNGNGVLSLGDLMLIVNGLLSLSAAASSSWPERLDVDANGRLTAADAVMLVNALLRKSQSQVNVEEPQAVITPALTPAEAEAARGRHLSTWAEALKDFSHLAAEDFLLPGDTPPDSGVVEPIRVFPIVIGNDSEALSSFQAIADGTDGKVFRAATAGDVVAAILDAVGSIDVNHSPQIVSLTNSAEMVGGAKPNQAVSFSAVFSDEDTTDTYAATIDWGDGTQSIGTVNKTGAELGTITASHNYATGGLFEISVSLSDNRDGRTQAVTRALISGVVVQNNMLNIIGTASDDTVSIDRDWHNRLTVSTSFSRATNVPSPFLISGVAAINIWLGDGRDSVCIDRRIVTPATIDAGPGNDCIKSGAGADVIYGGLGDDFLDGGPGADLLFGGDGCDSLIGGPGDDFLDGGDRKDRLL